VELAFFSIYKGVLAFFGVNPAKRVNQTDSFDPERRF